MPEAVGVVVASGVTLHDWHGLSTSLRLRFFGPRDLTSDGNFRSSSTTLVDLGAGYQLTDRWRLSFDILNLFDRRDHDIDYAYESRVTPQATPAFENVFHPVEPIQVRGGVTARF